MNKNDLDNLKDKGLDILDLIKNERKSSLKDE